MLTFVIRRILFAIPTLLLISFVIFFMEDLEQKKDIIGLLCKK